MKSIKYSKFESLEKKERNTFKTLLKVPSFKLAGSSTSPRFKDTKLNKLAGGVKDLISFTLDIRNWLSLIVMQSLITGEIILSYGISSFEIYSPIFFRKASIITYEIMIKILIDLDNQVAELTRGAGEITLQTARAVVSKKQAKSLFEKSTYVKIKLEK